MTDHDPTPTTSDSTSSAGTSSHGAVATAPSCRKCQEGTTPAPVGSPIIALVGAPNSGKSTLFNALTGSKVSMGNWPGTTVEVSRGAWHTTDAHGGQTVYDLIDFPGAYSLEPMSPDEALTREMLVERPPEDRPALVIVVVDAASPARGLYLAEELAEYPYRVIAVLTKNDVAENRGRQLDPAVLSDRLGFPVIAVDPRRRHNVEVIARAVADGFSLPPKVLRPAGATEHSPACTCPPDGDDPHCPCCHPVDPAEVDADDMELAEVRFSVIDDAVAAASADRPAPVTATERIDRLALNPVVGPLLFLVVMWVVFQITTTVAAPLQDALDDLFSGPVSDWVTSFLGWAHLDHPLVTGLIVDGLVGGVGMVLTFAPLMALMFLCLAVLEDSGYMARAAVVTDRLMRAIGLPGKAFIPLIVGFGCNVPAISATRVLSNPRQRILTALLIPFTACSARLTVYVMLAAVFFPDHAGSVVFAMYLISILLIVLTGLALRHTLWRRMPSEPLVIDLPTYQLPVPRLAFSVMWVRLKGFLQTAGGIIVATVAVVWLLQSIPAVGGYGIGDEDLPPQDSVYGVVSESVSPVFTPSGFDSWSLTGPLITGFVAKEAVISTWAQTYAVEDVTDDDAADQAKSPLAQNIERDFAETSGGHALAAVWAYMVFLLAYTPCVATLAAQKREIGLRWTLFGIGVQLIAAWLLSVVTFQLLSLVL
jgi:ferrous iron transport protein B